LSQEEAAELFELGARQVTLGGVDIEATVDTITELHKLVADLKLQAVETRQLAGIQIGQLVRAIDTVEELASAQRLTQESVEALAASIASLPTEGRNTLMGFLTGLSSSLWATALVEQVHRLIG